jgi:hypothetical protein
MHQVPVEWPREQIWSSFGALCSLSVSFLRPSSFSFATVQKRRPYISNRRTMPLFMVLFHPCLFSRYRNAYETSRTFDLYASKVYGRWLLGTAGTWFLFDIVFYAQNLFSASILKVVGIQNPTLEHIATQNVLVACVALPGYYVAVLFINRLGRRKMQLQGFFFMSMIFIILSGVWTDLQNNSTVGNFNIFVNINYTCICHFSTFISYS